MVKKINKKTFSKVNRDTEKDRCSKKHKKHDDCKKSEDDCKSSEDDCKKSEDNNCKKHDNHHKKNDDCTDRNFLGKEFKIRCKLGELRHKHFCELPQENCEEIKYRQYNYNGSFHKPLQHDIMNGHLTNSNDYETMRDAILSNDQEALASVPLATGSTIKLVNPLSSLVTALIGAPARELKVDASPKLSSKTGAAEMVELYSQAWARDVAFEDYGTDGTIATILSNTYMNDSTILSNLKYYAPLNTAFIAKTLFRGITLDEQVGPYISQLLLLDVPMGAGLFKQLYTTLLPRGGPTVEWGVNATETINIQNGNLTGLAPLNSAIDPTKKYIFSGRSLAEAVHNDPAYQFFYQAVLILSAAGTLPNPGMPQYPNQTGFNTGFGGPSVQCAIADVAGLALKAAWYWKWQIDRKLRPEVFGLWIDNVRTNPSSNAGNYDISNVVLNNPILNDIFALYGSHTLPLCYREGSPAHPAFPSGHSAISGACATIMKIFFDTEHAWGSLTKAVNGSLSGGVLGPVIPDSSSTFTTLIQYTDADASAMSIWGEINKLASNVAIGRNWSGIHYRSDAIQGILLGEQVAIKYMEDILATCVENNIDGSIPKITFRKFDGQYITIKPTTCFRKCHCKDKCRC